MIGSMEHIYNQNDILHEIKEKKIKIFIHCCSLFFPSSFIEIVFNKYFQGLLAPQHTHLYTDKSLRYLEKCLNLRLFLNGGLTDIVDLYRNFF